MKKTFVILLLIGWTFIANAQTTKQKIPASSSAVSVEKSIYGIQSGILGIWFNNEARLSNSIVLRSELGFSSQLWFASQVLFGPDVEADFYITPVVRLEPRWYFNLKKRNSEGKRIDGNSGNFLALEMSYCPLGISIPIYGQDINPILTVSPLWGLKRNIGHHFNYEVAVGLGYAHYFSDNEGYGESGDVFFSLLLRIGYRFQKSSVKTGQIP